MYDPTCASPSLEKLFKPGGIAVVGASSDPNKLGYKLVRNIVEGGFEGKVFPVNIKGSSVHGIDSVRSISDIEDEIDIAIICLPSSMVKGSLVEIGQKGIPYAVIISAGFREVGNLEEEIELVQIAERYGTRLLGPNVFGLIYTPHSLNAQFGPGDIMDGRVAIITQSGALGAALMGKAFEEGIGVSGVVSTGNKADISDEELLEFFCSDHNTDAILLYLEGLKDGRRFMETVSSVSKVKPIIVVKSGRTEEGARAVKSHTASLAGNDRIFDGAFEQTGVIRAPTIKDAIDWTRTLIDLPAPVHRNVLIITNGGGLGAIAVDELTKASISLYDDIDWIKEEMGSIFPPYATMNNPVDITAQVPYPTYLKGLKKAMENEHIGAVIGIYAPTSGSDIPAFTKDMIESIGIPKKPVMICTFGGRAAMDQIQELKKHGIPAFYYPEEVVSSLATLYTHYDFVGRRAVSSEDDSMLKDEQIDHLVRSLPDGFSDLPTAIKLMEAGPFRYPHWNIIDGSGKISDDTDNMKYPVVLKTAGREIVHKSDSGGVLTSIGNRGELMDACGELGSISRDLVVMEQISGTEMIMGAVRDPVFGPVVMFGLGGPLVEVLQDIVFRVAPLSEDEAYEMLRSIRSSKVLEGIRGSEPVDRRELADMLRFLGDLMFRYDRIQEVEVNPVFLTRDGPMAVDARVRTGP